MDLKLAEVTRVVRISRIFDHKARANHPPTLSMVIEALKAQNEKKGTSVIAIKRYILAKYPAVDPIRLKYLLKKALTKGLDHGYLIRPQNSLALGATGRFKLASEKSMLKKTSRKMDPAGEKALKSEKKVAQKPKAQVTADKKAGSKDTKEEKPKPVSKKPKAKSTNAHPKAPAKLKTPSDARNVVKGDKKPSMKQAPQARAVGTKKATSKEKLASEAEHGDKIRTSKAKGAAPGAMGAAKAKVAKGENGPAKAKAAGGTKRTTAKGKPETKGPAKGKGKKPEAATGSLLSKEKDAREGKASKTGSKLGKKAN
ncbi:histone H1.8 [Chelonoidis abingdonii]|uniref:histone H1.8 n=1 Tax=Chelonoidis abingdonii TaxID=106734 RepID=UPI0013F26DC4|nr:protein B4 [Chelonoidis abingdonii]